LVGGQIPHGLPQSPVLNPREFGGKRSRKTQKFCFKEL